MVLGCVWLYTACLFMLPATLMASRGHRLAPIGGYLFLFTLWMGGW